MLKAISSSLHKKISSLICTVIHSSFLVLQKSRYHLCNFHIFVGRFLSSSFLSRFFPYFHGCMGLASHLGKLSPMTFMLEICPRGNNKYSYYYIFVFMINVYIHAIIVLTRKQ